MVSFFRRKKPESGSPTPSTSRFSAEELAAAFPQAPSAASPASVDPALAFPAPAAADLQSESAAAGPASVPAPAAAPALIGTPEPQDDARTPTPALAPEVAATALPAPGRDALAAAPAAEAPPARLDPAAEPGAHPAIAPQAGTSADPDAALQPAAAAGSTGWRERLRNSAFARSFGGLFSRNPRLDDDLLDEIETALITADVGVTATTTLVEGLRRRMKAREFADARALLAALRTELVAMLRPVSRPLQIDPAARPFVLLTVGVNGVGKTTTIGKLARRFKHDGHSLMLAAGDTFRAAAVAQLQAWGERNGVTVIAQGQNADAASVAFDALQAARARGTGVLIADTAGRLHTQVGLMNELGKIKRVLSKLDPAAPHEVLMVIDGTTGQNALNQLRQFNAAVGVTGLVVTKLDGTAKGGVVFALAREFNIPIRFAGIGERPEDLRVFDPEAFVDALLPEALGA